MLTVFYMGSAQEKTVYMWIDLTDEVLMDAHKEKAKEAAKMLFNSKSGLDGSIKFKIMGINHELISNTQMIVNLPKGTSGSLCITCQSKKERTNQVSKALNELLRVIDEVQPIAIYETRIYENMNEELWNLSDERGEKYAIVFSDLLENSPVTSMYSSGGADVSKIKFGADLSNINVYLIRSCRQEKDFNVMCDEAISFWRTAFRNHGVNPKVNSRFILK